MRGGLILGTLAASAAAGLAYQADQLARMARTEYGWRAGRPGNPVTDDIKAQWSGIMQSAVNRARRHRVLPSQIITTRRGQGRAVWNAQIDSYLAGMAQRGPGTPGYADAFAIALRVLLGGRPYVDIGRRNGFVHRKTQIALGREIPPWNDENPLTVGDTTFSGPA